MARMHSRKKGKSGSKRPVVKEPPKWVNVNKEKMEEVIVKLAKKGETQSKIGMILRDMYGIPNVKLVLGASVSEILKKHNLISEIPEDMKNLMKKAVNLSEHLTRNPKDLHNKRGLQLIQSKIRRLEKYYKRKKILPANWRYSLDNAKLMLSK